MYQTYTVRYASGAERTFTETPGDIRETAGFYQLSLGRITHINGKRVF